jgi:5'-3' exonuclease
MIKYILIDTANLFFKSRHVASMSSTDEEKVGMAMHLTLSGVQSVVRKYVGHDPVHVVFCLEGRSWRKDVYEPYKRNRAVKHAALTQAEVELDTLFWDTYDEFSSYLQEKTNCSVLRCATAEADDLIARFIHLHPNDEHYIVSSDTDFIQLISPNVKQYNSLQGHLITDVGVYNDRGSKLSFSIDSKGKLKVGNTDVEFIPTADWTEYALFLKCMRGDTGDNVFSAYPGVREKSTKKTVGLMEAFADRTNKGFNWNNVMMQRWADHNGIEHKVLDDYERNRMLIDLTRQPDDIKKTVDESIITGVKSEPIGSVGVYFMKFCAKHQLEKISEYAQDYGRWLNSPYVGNLK